MAVHVSGAKAHRLRQSLVGDDVAPTPRSRTVRVILVHDDKPRTRGRVDRDYGFPLVTTDLDASAEDLVARYASPWGIEQAFADARQLSGRGRNRTRRAVERTVPFGVICSRMVTVW